MPKGNIKIIKPVKIDHHDLDAKGKEIQPILYANTLMVARKRSGKTTLLYHCIKHLIDSRTKVLVFCATHNKDEVWTKIKHYLRKHRIQSQFFYNLDDFSEIIAGIEQEMDETQEQEKDHSLQKLLHNVPVVLHNAIVSPDEEKHVKTAEESPAVPRYMVVMDDIGLDEARHHIFELAKKNRHLKCKFFVSLQDSLQIKPSVLMQFDYLWLFKGLETDYLKRMYRNISLPIDYEKFEQLYRFVTSIKYMFLNIHLATNKFFINFDEIENDPTM